MLATRSPTRICCCGCSGSSSCCVHLQCCWAEHQRLLPSRCSCSCSQCQGQLCTCCWACCSSKLAKLSCCGSSCIEGQQGLQVGRRHPWRQHLRVQRPQHSKLPSCCLCCSHGQLLALHASVVAGPWCSCCTAGICPASYRTSLSCSCRCTAGRLAVSSSRSKSPGSRRCLLVLAGCSTRPWLCRRC